VSTYSKYKFAIDLLIWVLATPLAFWLRLDVVFSLYLREALLLAGVSIPLKAFAIYRAGLHRQSWEKVSIHDLLALIKAMIPVTALLFIAVIVFQKNGFSMPRSAPLIEAMLVILFLGGIRLLARFKRDYRGKASIEGNHKRVLIVGAGEAGTIMAREMARHPEAGLKPIGFLDDERRKQRQTFMGLPVLGRIEDLVSVSSEEDVDEVLIAIPSAPGTVVRRVVELAREAGVKERIIPGIYDLLSGKISVSEIREVDVEDLLRRDPVRLDVAEIAQYLKDRTVLVTGAGGSIGSEIVRQIAGFKPGLVILLGRGENSIYQIEQYLRHKEPELNYQTFIADVRDFERLSHLFRTYRPQVVFHAAAHKHVPLMEADCDEAIHNNVGGTRNLVRLALEYGVERFVNISTDKAVNPTSVMGASKRIAEYIVSWGAGQAAPGQVFASVRFGNVLGSRGSVIPLFKEQIRRGGPVTVTHPDMTRYFMTIPEASELVLQAGGLGENGSVYVLDMGEPVRIVDLARDLIRLSGFRPDVDIEIKFAGIRPGEKLYEELLTDEEGTMASRHQKIFVARKAEPALETFEESMNMLFAAAASRDGARVREVLKYLIPSYTPSTSSTDSSSKIQRL
jgi:FlaA1/EpsC-like NDP-sugar epimerase